MPFSVGGLERDGVIAQQGEKDDYLVSSHKSENKMVNSCRFEKEYLPAMPRVVSMERTNNIAGPGLCL